MKTEFFFDQPESSCEMQYQPSPIVGLLAARKFDATTHRLVMHCDYPFVTVEELQHLRTKCKDHITYSGNRQGSAELFVAILSPQALGQLAKNVLHGITDPKKVLEQLERSKVSPKYDHGLFNTNAKEDWDSAMMLLLTKV